LQCEALEARDVSAAWYAVNLESPAQDELGESALTISEGGLQTTGAVMADSPVDAVIESLGAV